MPILEPLLTLLLPQPPANSTGTSAHANIPVPFAADYLLSSAKGSW